MYTNKILYAFILTLVAGLSTGIGSLMVLLTKRTNKKFLSISLGFSAGVMIYLSFVEIYSESEKILKGVYGDKKGFAIAAAAFFGGILLIALIDKLIPSFENPHESRSIEEIDESSCSIQTNKLYKASILMIISITIHNFPEGIATFTSAMHNPALGFATALAVALHNIPEGISVAIPVYYATCSRRKAFLWSFLSGFSEPLGALIGYLILMPFINDTLFAILFAATAGIMVFISLDELLPNAREYGEDHFAIYGLIGGMITISVSLFLLP